jgi:hypothetical protein
MAIKTVVSSWLKPMSSSHTGAKECADHGNEPVALCATKIWHVEICTTKLASLTIFTTISSPRVWPWRVGKCGSTARNKFKAPTRTLTTATRGGTRQQQVDEAAGDVARLLESCSHLKPEPRVASSVQTATSDSIDEIQNSSCKIPLSSPLDHPRQCQTSSISSRLLLEMHA